MSVQFLKRNSYLSLDWIPREENKEAEALSEACSPQFDPSKRIPVKIEDMKFEVLDQMLEYGSELYGIVRKNKEESKMRKIEDKPDEGRETEADRGKGERKRKKRPEERLRIKDPW